MSAVLPSILNYAHQILAQAIQVGDTVIDATAGNGHDTLFLAQQVGENGKVWAFDIQNQAIENTQQRLKNAQICHRVQTILASHEHIADYVAQPVAAAIFNFGYLPGGDKQLTTQTQSSLNAVQSVLKLLKKGGVAVLVLYPGHPEGAIESQVLQQFAANLPQPLFSVAHYAFINRKNQPPHIIMIEKQ